MREIAKTGAGALTVPDTLATYELGAPIPKPVQDFVIKSFLAPILLKYDGGRTLSDAEWDLLMVDYAEDIVGFMPEAYRIAGKLMGRDRRKGNWRPDPGECREWLQKAEDDLCARTGRPQQIRDQTELKRAMLGGLCLQHGETITIEDPFAAQPWNRKRTEYVAYPTAWDRARHGPMPTELGCRLDAATQRECWIGYFQFDQMRYEHEASGDQVKPLSRAASLRRKARRLEALGIAVAPPTCGILRAVMTEQQVPMTTEEIAKTAAEIADHKAKVAAKEAADKERKRISREREEVERKERAEREEAERLAALERGRRKRLEHLATCASELTPEMQEARNTLRKGGERALEIYQSAMQTATAQELERMLADPAYAEECRRKVAIATAAGRAALATRLAEKVAS